MLLESYKEGESFLFKGFFTFLQWQIQRDIMHNGSIGLINEPVAA